MRPPRLGYKPSTAPAPHQSRASRRSRSSDRDPCSRSEPSERSERHQSPERASARSSLSAIGRRPAGRRRAEGSRFRAARTRNPVRRCVARNWDSARRQPDTGHRSLSSPVPRFPLPANFGLREISPSEASSFSLPCECLPEVRSPPSGGGRQGDAGQRVPRFARYALVTLSSGASRKTGILSRGHPTPALAIPHPVVPRGPFSPPGELRAARATSSGRRPSTIPRARDASVRAPSAPGPAADAPSVPATRRTSPRSRHDGPRSRCSRDPEPFPGLPLPLPAEHGAHRRRRTAGVGDRPSTARRRRRGPERRGVFPRKNDP